MSERFQTGSQNSQMCSQPGQEDRPRSQLAQEDRQRSQLAQEDRPCHSQDQEIGRKTDYGEEENQEKTYNCVDTNAAW